MSWVDIAMLGAMLAGTTLVRIHLPFVDLAANNLVVPLCAAVLAWRARAALPATLRIHRRLLVATLVLYGWAWVSAVYGIAPLLSLRYAAKYGAYAFIFVCFLVVLQRRVAVRTTLRTTYAALVLLAMLGIVEYWFPGGLFGLLRGPLIVYPRVASLLVWPNQFAVLTATALALGAGLWRAGWLSPQAFVAALPVLIVALALSGSRNGWFVCGAVLAALAWRRILRRRDCVAIGALLGIALITFPASTVQLGLHGAPSLPLSGHIAAPPKSLAGLSTPVQTLKPRLALWKAALREITRHPLSGIGLEAFPRVIAPTIFRSTGLNTHNLILNVTAELGLVGLALLAMWLRELFRAGDPRNVTTAIPLVALGLGQVFDCFFYDYAFMTGTALLAACYASLPRASG